jgi:hypothetical protein
MITLTPMNLFQTAANLIWSPVLKRFPTLQFALSEGGIGWIPGSGDPRVENPAPDQILVSFDACAGFAQTNVKYVLSSNRALASPCLETIDSFALPKETATIYRVTKKLP